MNHRALIIVWKIISRKLAVILLLAVSAFTAFATLGDGKVKSTKRHGSLLTDKDISTSRDFSLKSGYTFRGSQVINTQTERYLNLNTVVTFQKGQTTYVIPLKKKVLLDKITFNPNAETRHY
ncbi:MAG: hypothetical protein JJE22_17915 [Bacteroidia bacterium]|nr:hypothetical protein [Bacteroidia bacterium]